MITHMVYKSDSDELAALRAENARLVSLLEAHGIVSCTEGKRNWKLMGLNGDVNRRVLCSAFPYYPRMRKLRYFVDCFAGVMMYGPFDGKAKPALNQGTRGPALTNCSRE